LQLGVHQPSERLAIAKLHAHALPLFSSFFVDFSEALRCSTGTRLFGLAVSVTGGCVVGWQRRSHTFLHLVTSLEDVNFSFAISTCSALRELQELFASEDIRLIFGVTVRL